MTDTTATAPALARRDDFHPDARVWVYVSDKALKPEQTAAALEALRVFVQKWTAHNQALKAAVDIVDDRVVVLMVDETQAGASGCSIDKSVHFLEHLGRDLNVDFFDRQRFGVLLDGRVQWIARDAFAGAVADGRIGPDTPVVNTLAATRRELLHTWLTPFAESWHRRLV